jgi:hypothetical protein
MKKLYTSFIGKFIFLFVLSTILDVFAATSAIAYSKGVDFIDTRTSISCSKKAEFVETRDYTTGASSLFVETIDTATPIFTLIIIR